MLSFSLAIASIVFFLSYLLFTTYIYKKESGETFSFRNSYPFELWIKRSRSFSWANIILFIALGLGFGSFLSFTIQNFNVNSAFLSFYALLSFFGVLTLFYIPPYKLKAFLMFAIVSSISVAILNFQLIFIFFRDVNFMETTFFYVALIISLLLGLIGLVSSFFIRIDDLKMLKDEKGNLIRPKIILMAVSEWLVIIAAFLTQIALVIYIMG